MIILIITKRSIEKNVEENNMANYLRVKVLWYAILKYDMHFEQVFFKGELQVVIYSLFNLVKLGIINQ